jgi:hypothetical protein
VQVDYTEKFRITFDFKNLCKCPVDGFLWAISERPREAIATIGCSVFEALFSGDHEDCDPGDLEEAVSSHTLIIISYGLQQPIYLDVCSPLGTHGERTKSIFFVAQVVHHISLSLPPNSLLSILLFTKTLRGFAAGEKDKCKDRELGANDAHAVPQVKLHRQIRLSARNVSIPTSNPALLFRKS